MYIQKKSLFSVYKQEIGIFLYGDGHQDGYYLSCHMHNLRVILFSNHWAP